MYFRHTTCLLEILRRPRDVVLTVVSRLRTGWKIFRKKSSVKVTGTVVQSGREEKRLENEALFVASLVSKIVEDAFPGRQVAVRARLKGNPQAAVRLLRHQFPRPGNGD